MDTYGNLTGKNLIAIVGYDFKARRRIEQAEDRLKDFNTGQHQRGLGQKHALRLAIGRDDRLGGDVAGGHIFSEEEAKLRKVNGCGQRSFHVRAASFNS